MITAVVIKNPSGYASFQCKGHAGFMRKGRDIVCAAVSMLTINTANSIMTLTDTRIEATENDGFLSWTFKTVPGRDAALLMDSMILGLRSVEEDYNGKYLTLEIKEV